MTFKNTLVLFISLSFFGVYAQLEEKPLFTIDNQPILVSEFLRVYNKNLDIVTDENQKDINNYLDLFINYKLKIKQAHDLGFDTLSSYKTELLGYKKQLMEPYLKDDSVIEKLVQEAYSRSLYEINASHILVMVKPSATPADTIQAYEKIVEARNLILAGNKFNDVATKYSEDPSVQRNLGDLGYFSAFSMVFPFEDAAYTTVVNEISKPFRTRFGYHILKVHDKRKTRGEVEASHIMVKGDTDDSFSKINEIYNQLLDGKDFANLAKTQSEDVYSAKKNGSLGRFGAGKMVKEFEQTVFSLKNIGDISQPFKTAYGWHIVKLDNVFPMPSFEEVKKNLTEKVKRGDKAKSMSNSIVFKLLDEYNIIIRDKALKPFKKEGGNEKRNKFSKTLMSIQDKEISQKKLFDYLDGRQLTNDLLKSFKEKEVLDYYKNDLELNNKEFIYSYKEYEEGLLLFELLQNRIWDKSKDSLGIENYFKNHKKEFVSTKSIEGVVATCTNKETALIVKEQLSKNTSLDEIKKLTNIDDQINVLFKSGLIEYNKETIPSEYNFKNGVSDIYEFNNSFIVIKTDSVIPSKQLELKEVKGRVVNKYQEYLEEQWIDELRSTYTIDIDSEVLKSVLEKY
ncbi:peptidylprolyl isomerase [Urechidicola croceus]|uniref:PpiC domain-containing protein n=1 Tax=Urechidicola croceus TaxID=1850246 RepID=A0A1D8P4R8_9FLAO|nr:peptidylprolyl isomerase [Urechidicola croceus]AOW19556.1 hypothetical protein LPB138_02175 [Urechidicola croceus]